MEKIAIPPEFISMITTCNAAILYTPINGEIDFNDQTFVLALPQNRIVVPHAKNSDPYIWADMCIDRFKNDNPYILIPGTRFDKYGTRYGKGVGWYDRFLSTIPREWQRIGIAHTSQISSSPLKREMWDEPIDWLITHDGIMWSAFPATINRNSKI